LKEKDLPLELPEDVTFKGVGNPLLTSKSFLETSCPSCGKPGKRETDTMGGFMDSSWYFLRFADPLNTKKPFDLKKARYWMSVDQYVGGIEHAVGHLIYSRFFTKALRDLGFLEGVDEPFTRLFNQGYLYGADGRKMSKSYPDAAVTQEEVSKKYGIDSARLFLLFVAAPDSSMEWNDKGMEGVSRFVKRVLGLRPGAKSDKRSEHYRNRFVKEITADIENFRFNLAIIKLMKWRDVLSEQCERKSYADFVKMFSVFAPHIAEELWEKLGGKGLVSLSKWPEVDEKKIDMKLEAAEEAGKDIMHVLGFVKEKSGADPEEVHVYVMPQELKGYNAKALSDRVGVPVIVWSVADKKKVDPDGKSKKAKPGKPGIWVR
jgi:leucyl-tRNA synthetase